MTTSLETPLPPYMKGVQVTEFGGVEVLKVTSKIPVPKPKAKQVNDDNHQMPAL